MTTLIPREPYSPEELERLYPKGLKLQLVQVFLRHGERTPVSSRFQNTGLAPCNSPKPRPVPYDAATQLTILRNEDLSSWNGFQFRRKMESFGNRDQSVVAVGAGNEIEGICQHGELTDKGRETTYALGQRLRHLYVDQLGFMPAIRSDSEDMYLRATPIPRALESLQQAFWGMYPTSARTLNFPPPVIVARSVSEETLFPNEGNCRRFRQLARLFADRAASRWNDSEQMEYLNKLWSKYMPEASPKVAVDAHPRLSGIMDTINATDAHGPATKLPSEFYDKKGRAVIDRIAVEEWFAGYNESTEYRKLGIGALMGDVVDRMVSTAVDGGWRSETSASGSGKPGDGKSIKFAMSGCHDTTLAAILSSLPTTEPTPAPCWRSSPTPRVAAKKTGLFSSLLGNKPTAQQKLAPSETARAPIESFPEETRESLRKHYVRLRFNDQPVYIPGCASKPENHLPGDESFCTLDAFKEIVDKFTPKSWQDECMQNLGQGLHGPNDQERSPAGF
ncbi:Histidine phosphatase superfamily clade-2 [Penicillium cosmopolitanum]|uniref:Histidine phosphatase superfamily clade-2 n=1 Tax=Penicillium cosmopolitanum TaxID=1131564 RepID=A0A9W9SI27_9EURO|nr:Histidine phosphatase superfamily clade-2 [Penicillium cosmopolitanum]KAJ5378542.1 Histidine phosphatase superfamily clade-2 [Penicillium cosmopolitanum]